MVAGVLLVAFVVYLAGAPHQSDDFWFHLAMGEAFASAGPWLGADPLLHTAHPTDPVPHEWLFDALLSVLESGVGLGGLRVVHAGIAALAFWLAWVVLRGARLGRSTAAAALAVFAVLVWWRIFQLRPELVTIPATLAFYAAALAPDRPIGTRRWLAVGALVALWANAHSAFLLAPLLLTAAWIGHALVWALARGPMAAPELAARHGRAVAGLTTGLAVVWLGSGLNPRGFAQHTTYWSLTEGAVMPALDDWLPLSLLHWVDFGAAMGPLEWALAHAVLAAFLGTATWAGIEFLRRRDAASLERLQLPLLGVALASSIAMVVAVRFLWLGLFPLLFALSWAPVRARADALGGRIAAVVVAWALVLAFATAGRYAAFAVLDPRAYTALHFSASKYQPSGVAFLQRCGVRGRLFNAYHQGGFAAYWLAPDLRTFIDGRNEAYPPSVYRDFQQITARASTPEGGDWLDVLEDRGVDLFFGSGLPLGSDPAGVRVSTTRHMDGVPGWTLVFRSVDVALYLRANERNRANLERVAACYQRDGVPFDPAVGFSPARVAEEALSWGVENGVLPLHYEALRRAADGAEAAPRQAALNQLGLLHALLGDDEGQRRFDERLAGEVPGARQPRRRLVLGALRQDEPERAARVAAGLQRLAPRTPLDRALPQAVREYRALRRRNPNAPWRARAAVDRWPVLSREDAVRWLAGRFREPPLARRSADAPPGS
ncbi:MAG: hypothetical protein MJE66_18095 [Proteobacteria bacterium]|nr:hypothetical protein [Pseudomonadota bacterium]